MVLDVDVDIALFLYDASAAHKYAKVAALFNVADFGVNMCFVAFNLCLTRS